MVLGQFALYQEVKLSPWLRVTHVRYWDKVVPLLKILFDKGLIVKSTLYDIPLSLKLRKIIKIRLLYECSGKWSSLH